MWSALRSIWIVFKHIFYPRLTVQYPETKRRLPPRWRGRIVLTRDARGEERCVACNLCAAVCPPSCISLQAGKREDGRRFASFFRINFSRCIFCGFCEEACPTYAIQLTPDYEMSEFERKNLVYEKEDLMVSGEGKYPGYDFYQQSGVNLKGTEAGKPGGGKRRAPVDSRSLLP